MQDQEVLNEIGKLIDEEHRLLERSPQQQLAPEEHERLRALEVSLDQCWDLLRQRRARREFHQEPDTAQVRDASTVERFQQ
jgi:uncharacterized protein DUF2630